MSYYAHNPFLYSQRQTPRGYGHPFASSTHNHSAYANFDLEEQAALAHLASIRQRREAAEQVAQREAAVQAHIAAQRQAAIVAAFEREQLRDQAIRQALAAREERQQAIRQALAARQEREQAIRQAIAAQEERRAIALEHHRRHLAARQAHQAASNRLAEESRRRKECARRCAGSCHQAEKSDKAAEPENEEWKHFNDVLGALFGINLIEPVRTKVQEQESVAPVKEEVAQSDAPVATSPVASGSASTVNTTGQTDTVTAANDDPRVVADLGELISKFLNVNIEPAAETDQSSNGAEALTARVNDFLHQFGLEFESDSASAETKFSKGKEVAEGEKPNPPVPSAAPAQPTTVEVVASNEPNSSAALGKLRDISHELHLVTESFTFPSSLAFAPTPSVDEAVPALLFNKSNSGYHAQAHKLLQLLLAADGVSSGGDKNVRKQRKAIVKAIEGAIEKLEQKRDAVWNEVKDRRNRGEESDDEGSVSSWATESTHEAQHTEHAETVQPADPAEEVPSTAVSQGADAAATATDNVEDKPIEGFEVPEVNGKGDDAPSASASQQTEEKKQTTDGVSDEKDEFELL